MKPFAISLACLTLALTLSAQPRQAQTAGQSSPTQQQTTGQQPATAPQPATTPGQTMPPEQTPQQSTSGQAPNNGAPQQTAQPGAAGQPTTGTTGTTTTTQPGQTTTGQPTTGTTTTGAPGQTAPGQAAPGQTTPGQTVPGQTVPGQAAPGQPAPGQAAAGQAAPIAQPAPQVNCPPPAPAVNPSQRSWGKGPQAQQQYNDYKAALAATDPAQRAQLFGAFVQKYPTSDFKVDAQFAKMEAEANGNNVQQAVQDAEQLIQSGKADSTIMTNAYTILAYDLPELIQANDPQMQSKLQWITQASVCGPQAINAMAKPANVSDQQFEQQKQQTQYVFARAAGFAALQRKDYPAVKQSLQNALQQNAQVAGKDPLVAYWLGLAYLYDKPADFNNGIFYLARAVNLAPQAAEFKQYLTTVYTGHHGSDQGLQDVLTLASTNVTPPAGFKVQSQAEIQQAQLQQQQTQAAAQQPAANELPPEGSFEGIKARLMLPDQERQQWSKLKGQVYQFNGTVVSSVGRTLRVAVSKDDAQARKPDLVAVLTAPRHFAAGTQVTVEGTVQRYTTSPFLLTLVQATAHRRGGAAATSARTNRRRRRATAQQ